MPATAMRAALMAKPQSALPLTVSGNETADLFGISRKTNTQGDGRTFPDKSVGIWPAATNLNDNGNATTNTTGVTDHSSTTTRATSGVVQFGSTAFNVVSSNLAANEGPSQPINGGLGSTKYTVSAWVWLISGAATVRATLSDSVSGKQGGTAVALTATPQRVTVTATTGVAGVTEASYIETTVQQVGTWRIGGWQVETGAIATPYIQTDGADASRSVSRVQRLLTGVVTPTQGWLSVYLRMGWQAGVTKSFNPTVFIWVNGTSRIHLFYRDPTLANPDKWSLRRTDGTIDNTLTSSVASTHVRGDLVLLTVQWSPSTLYLTTGATAFQTLADASVPSTLTGITADFGTNSGNEIASNVVWLAMGSGLLADAKYLNMVALGGGVPDLYECPGNATLVWDGRNAVATVRG